MLSSVAVENSLDPPTSPSVVQHLACQLRDVDMRCSKKIERIAQKMQENDGGDPTRRCKASSRMVPRSRNQSQVTNYKLVPNIATTESQSTTR